jgi:type I restriction enzyme R subunit
VQLNIAAVFSPPGDVSADVRQIQEDLPTELENNQADPEGKKAALQAIIASYNDRFGTNHRIEEFDLYYQDVQQRIKDQQWPDADLRKASPQIAQHKLDITIVVDMLLTGFDSKHLNTLYVDKNLKHHGLIQAFSRTNRVLNDTKPFGHILDFRGQQDAVDAAIALFSGAKGEAARKIWLVDKAPAVIEKLQEAKDALQSFMHSYGLSGKPEEIAKLQGDDARIGFVEAFKKVQKLQTRLEQYTDLTPEQEEAIQSILPKDELNAFRGQYLETAKRLRDERAKPGGDNSGPADQLDFEFVLFASATIDYDYIMKLIADFSTRKPGKATMSREQLVGLIAADAKFIDERDDITEYVMSLKAGEGLDERAIRAGYQQFKAAKAAHELAELAAKHGLPTAALQSFVDAVLERRIFDGEQLTELLAPLELGWKARTQKELALMADLVPMLKKRAGGWDISGLKAYED